MAWRTVTLRTVVLALAAVGVIGAAVYLFLEVRRPVVIEPVHVAAPERAPTPEPAAPTGPRVADKTAHPVGRDGTPVAEHTPPPSMGGGAPNEGAVDDPNRANPKLDAVMDEANRAYDRQDFDEARSIAAKVLDKTPNNIRMLRVMVSSSCIQGDNAVAQKYYDALPRFDRDQMRMRCDRYGVSFNENVPPPGPAPAP